MNRSMKQKQTHRYREQQWLPRGEGDARNGSLELAEANYIYIYIYIYKQQYFIYKIYI